MLRYLAFGPTRLPKHPVPVVSRLNWEFFVIANGQAGPVLPSGAEVIYQSKAMWLLPPQRSHGWLGKGNSCRRYTFHFASIPSELVSALGDSPYFVVDLSAKQISAIEEIANELEPHFKRPNQHSHIYFERAMLNLSVFFLNSLNTPKEVPLHQIAEHRVEQAISWFSINMQRRPTIDQVAEAIHITPAYLRRTIRKAREKTPHQLFRELQLKRAIELLSNTAETLESVARQCGFGFVEDFSRVFRNEMGTTPDLWRRTVLRSDNHKRNTK